MSEEKKIEVHIRYGDVEGKFSGDVEGVWTAVNRFFSQIVPRLEVVSKAMLTIDLSKLIEDFEGVVAVAPEGSCVLVPRSKLSDSDALALNLLAAYIGHKLGILSKGSLSSKELQAKLGKDVKTTSARLSELCRDGLVARIEDGEYEITTIGIRRLQEQILPKVKAKLS